MEASAADGAADAIDLQSSSDGLKVRLADEALTPSMTLLRPVAFHVPPPRSGPGMRYNLNYNPRAPDFNPDLTNMIRKSGVNVRPHVHV